MDLLVKFLLVLGSLAVLLQTANLAASSEILPPFPGKPNRCIKVSERVNMAVGETKYLPGCSSISCKLSQRGQLQLDKSSCGVASAPSKCKVVQDNLKNYPNCCPKIQCPK